jgi:chemotaxis protein MotB
LVKRKPNEQPAGLPIWLQTYGDMVTLVLTFFVALYAMSSLDQHKYDQMSNSLRMALSGGAGNGNIGVLKSGKSIVETGLAPVTSNPRMGEAEAQAWQNMYSSVKSVIDQNNFHGRVEVSYSEYGITISFKEKSFFQIGSADILREAYSLLNEVGTTINKQTYPIRVEGHTCDLPISNSRYPSNWELSVMRAVNVAKYLIESVKMAPDRVAVAGYGQYRPIVPNTNEENRARNRRVDIIIINSFYNHQEGQSRGIQNGKQ